MEEEIVKMLATLSDEPMQRKVEIYNRLSAALKEFIGLDHPVLAVQLVAADRIVGNDYNPNRVAPPEMALLKLSIRKDGLTMPVVAAREGDNYVVVDGFHRTEVIKSCADVLASTGGYVPVVELDKSIEDRITATVRHNLARGTHQVELSARLVTLLKRHNWSNARIGKELGMDADEVLRLKQITGLAEAFKDREFSKAWEIRGDAA